MCVCGCRCATVSMLREVRACGAVVCNAMHASPLAGPVVAGPCQGGCDLTPWPLCVCVCVCAVACRGCAAVLAVLVLQAAALMQCGAMAGVLDCYSRLRSIVLFTGCMVKDSAAGLLLVRQLLCRSWRAWKDRLMFGGLEPHNRAPTYLGSAGKHGRLSGSVPPPLCLYSVSWWAHLAHISTQCILSTPVVRAFLSSHCATATLAVAGTLSGHLQLVCASVVV